MQKSLNDQLLSAAETNHIAAVRQLFTRGASLTATDKKGEYNAIQLAAKCGSTEVVEFLVKVDGCPINSQSKSSGRTALHLASQYGHGLVVDALIKANCDLHLRTKLFGRTALHWAAVSGQYTIVERLLQAGSDVNVPDKSCAEMASEVAASKGISLQAPLLSIGSTALHMASQLGHKSTVGALLRGGAKVDVTQASGRTALHLAAMNGHSEVMELLIKAGADINRTTQRLQTPLHFAASGGHQNAVQVLLDCGCETECKNKLNMRPVDLAQNKGHEEIVEIILERQERDHHSGEPEHRKMVPREIDLRGPEVRRIYERACAEGKKKVYRARVMFVGQQGVGKTSLAKSLRGEQFQCDEPSTNGIDTDPSACVIDIKHCKSRASAGDAYNSAISGDIFNSTVARLVAAELKKKSVATEQNASDFRQGVEERKDGEDKPFEEPQQVDDGSSSEDEGFMETTVTPGKDSDFQDTDLSLAIGIQESPPMSELPDEITEILEQLTLEGVLDEDFDEDPEITLSFWDFGGQSVFYTTHQVFLTNRAIYILVLDATKALDAPVSPETRHSVHEIFAEQTTSKVKDYISFWLNSIHASVSRPQRSQANSPGNQRQPASPPDNRTQPASPAVILVGTHKDKLIQGVEVPDSRAEAEQDKRAQHFLTDVRKYLGDHLQAAHEHVLPEQFVVDNSQRARTGKDDPQLLLLQQQLYQVARQQSWMGEEIPIKWLRLEERIKSLKDDGVKFISLCEMEDIAKTLMIKKVSDVTVILQFYHDMGDIIYFNEPRLRDLVILDPQWLIDVFKSIITVRQYQYQSPHCRKYWDKLDKEGILDIQLVESMWDALGLSRHQAVLLDVMEKFDLICPCVMQDDDDDDDDEEEEEEEEEAGKSETLPANSSLVPKTEHISRYFVPSLLKAEIDEVDLLPPGSTSCQYPLCFHFQDGFLPNGLYHRLVARCLREWPCNARMYKNCAQFVLDENHDCLLSKSDSDITVNVVHTPLERDLENDDEPGPRWCMFVRRVVDGNLNDLIGQWVPGSSFRVCVKCPCSEKNLGNKSSRQCPAHYIKVSEKIVKKGAVQCKYHHRWRTEPLKRWFMHDASVKTQHSLQQAQEPQEETVGLFNQNEPVQCLNEKISAQEFESLTMLGSLKHVPFSTRQKMSMYLDDTSNRLLADYRSLASELNYTNLEISQFSIAFQQGKSPTLELLRSYESCSNSTIARVAAALIKLERHDVLKELFSGLNIKYCYTF